MRTYHRLCIWRAVALALALVRGAAMGAVVAAPLTYGFRTGTLIAAAAIVAAWVVYQAQRLAWRHLADHVVKWHAGQA